ncbi:60S ribosomal protein L36A [Cymbomonas tetramitiformis]|uniref:60S ribosomal protein L36A n=1 Tax=Cymbomonas tetramitiformis TaxID=36881 RepID=A0AAE0BUS9_9CHLO|nr:60S ribosomal protein L36A [Cymbomonas tetramitiformis]
MSTATGMAAGLNKGHIVTKRALAPRIAHRKGRAGKRVKMIRELIREVAGLAPYEKRICELLKVGHDKRALKVAKNKLGTHGRAKKKREDMANQLRKQRAAGVSEEKAKKKK